MTNTEKMKEILSDGAFVKSLFELETAAEVQVALREKGVELTEEEILAIRELLIKVESGEVTLEQLELWQKQAEDGELSDEALEQVAGGLFWTVVGIGTGIFAIVFQTVGGAILLDYELVRTTGRHW